MGTLTPTLQLSKPTINGQDTNNVWGYDLNSNFDKIDAWTGPLPDRISALEAGAGSGVTDWSNITGKPSTFPPSPHTHPELAPIANPNFNGNVSATGGFWTKGDAYYAGPSATWYLFPFEDGWQINGGLFANDGADEVWHKGNYGSKTISTVAPTALEGVDGDVWYQVPP